MLIGVDWGGTKIEIVVIDDSGLELVRERAQTPHGDYRGCLRLITQLVAGVENRCGRGKAGC